MLYFIFITNLVAAYANGFLYTARERRTPFKREHMSNSFVVTNCFYDDPSGDPNPLCYVTGTVNGLNVPLAPAFFRYLMAADATDQMLAALTVVMSNYYADVYRAQLVPTRFHSAPRVLAVRRGRHALRRCLSGCAGRRDAGDTTSFRR